jgi:hypothetical protein
MFARLQNNEAISMPEHACSAQDLSGFQKAVESL